MKCGICGNELDENGHCIPCERRAEMNNLRKMTLDEQLNYQGMTIDENGAADNGDDFQQPKMQYKVYRMGNSFAGNLIFYLILAALLFFIVFVILPIAATGIIVAVIAGALIGLWRYFSG